MATSKGEKEVRARFNFKGSNEPDELIFNKGDVITVTQQVDGGWWEGTLNGRTGWFPSNYVKEIKFADTPGKGVVNPKPVPSPVEPTEKQKYHAQVVQNLLDMERQHIQDLQTLLDTYLRPMESANVLSSAEHGALCGNLDDILAFHQSFLRNMEEVEKCEGSQRRLGSCFLKGATQYKALYSAYCANHPKAVAILRKHSDELEKFMESKGAPSPGIMLLTTRLSNPFRKMEKYPNLLKELERHTPSSHIDRIDVSTACSVYKNIHDNGVQIRKRKEIEYDIMTGTIQGWEGESITTLGDVIRLLQAAVEIEDANKERFLLLFPLCLVVLSANPSMSGYIFQRKIPLQSMAFSRCPDTDPEYVAFDITCGGADKLTIICESLMDREELLDAVELTQKGPATPKSAAVPINNGGQQVTLRRSSSPPSSNVVNTNISNSLPSSSPTRLKDPTITPAGLQETGLKSQGGPMKPKTISGLRPGAPVSPLTVWALKEGQPRSPKNKKKIQKGFSRREKNKPPEAIPAPKLDLQALEEDNKILKVIEAYCTSISSLTRNTINSGVPLVDPAPQVFLAEEEKIIVEETKGNETVVEEKSLIDTVYALRDQVKDLVDETKRLKKDLDDERRARKKLETTVRKSMKSIDIRFSDQTDL
ncbi:rho guanine nucleotide exchange factor 7-like isoform X2 [Amphiura filiformis]|uniref:rho guanine nucleotide exchange factor 7-like isoform X2 n=1 Tax=Amphiura filiformis TaxID=82378 RepID=UPI003B21273E